MNIAYLLMFAAGVAGAAEGTWSKPAEVQHDDHRVAAYRARISGDLLAVEVKLEPGWHTFALDNQKRAAEKLAGKKSLGIDQPTEITGKQGVEILGGWMQTAPKDFSKPELRWYSFGFEGQALFAAKVKRSGRGPVKLGVRGQACTDSVCKNVDLELVVDGAALAGGGVDLRGLVGVR